MNCTAVCPKGISPTRAIKFIERVGIIRGEEKPEEQTLEAVGEPLEMEPPAWKKIDRATFLRHAGVAALGVGAVATLGTVAAVTAVVPEKAAAKEQWVPLAKMSELPPGEVTTVLLKYQTKSGIYSQTASAPVLVSRLSDAIVCYKCACTHLGCTVRWDGRSDQFRCACHGGAFDRIGNVTAGPPPRPMDRYETKVDAGMLLVLV